MATTLQVTASTQQAVGAFNQLVQSINHTNSAFQQLNNHLAAGAPAAQRYGSGIERVVTGAFNKLQSAISSVIGLLQTFAGVIGAVFSALLRELDKIQGFSAIMSVTAKSTEAAASAYTFLRGTADRLGVQFDALTSNYAKLVAAIPEGTDKINIANKAFIGLAMAARTLHSSNQETQLMFYAVTQMASKGVLSMEELRRQLGEKLPNTMQVAARALSTTPELLEAAIRKGIVNSAKFIDAFGSELIRTFADSSALASQSVSASLNRLTNVWTDFVKAVLDSGAGDSIVRFFDALREKLSDPYVISRFADMVKYIADQFTKFVAGLTADDIRTGFDTLFNGVQMLIGVLGKFVELMTWVINNGEKAGVIVGAVGGLAAGAVAGGTVGSVVPGIGTAAGAVVGGAVGSVGGAYAGYKGGQSLAPNAEQIAARAAHDAAAQSKAAEDASRRQLIVYQQIIPMLQQFRGLKSLDQVKQLTDPTKVSESTVEGIAKILQSKQYKTDASKLDALIMLAKSGQVLSPRISLQDALQSPKKSKQDPQERRIDATFNRAVGLDSNFFDEWNNLSTLFKRGKLSVEELDVAYKKLLDKQPFMEERLRAEKKAVEADNKAYEQFLEMLLKQIDAREKLEDKLNDDLRLAGMTSDQQRIEGQVVQEVNRLKGVGINLSAKELETLRERFRVIENTATTTAAMENVLKATVDRYKPQIDTLKGIEQGLKDPKSGLTKQNATDYLVTQDQNASGSQEWLDAQRRMTEEYYIWVDTLRQKDLISEQTAQQMKARAEMDYQATRISQTSEFFSSLASLSSSSNKRISAIGKAAAVAQATIDGYVAVQKALASAPPPYNYALAAAVGVAAAANVAKIIGIGGFAEGGYTGNGSRGDVAGVVHGQEFVVNSNATARNRATLEAINAGRPVPASQESDNGKTTVIINNNAPDTQSRVSERDTPQGKEIEVTIERVVVNSIRRGGRVADAVESQYGLNRSVGTVR